MDKIYWENYYAAQKPSEQPSDFARYCANRHTLSAGAIIDIGCGNGRDTLFFATQSIPCVGIDQSKTAIEKSTLKKVSLGLNVIFHLGDFSCCDYTSLVDGPYSIYSRFTLHAIDYEEETKLFKKLHNARNLSKLYIEARSTHDQLYGQGRKVGPHEFITTHYRRFIEPSVLKAQLERDFAIEYFEEAEGFARIATEDPCLIRLIAKRK